MLNEIKEYEQYTYLMDSRHPAIRLKHKNLCNDLSGTARAMTIIARKSIFDQGEQGRERITRAKADLQLWCGDPKGNPDDASEGIVFAWLPNYMIIQLGEIKALEFENYLMDNEVSLGKSPRYSEVCALFKDVHADFNIETYLIKDNWKQLMDKAERLHLYYKELGDGEQRGKTTDSYAPFHSVIKALNKLSIRYGVKGYKKKMFVEDPRKTEKNDFKKIMYDKIIADAIVSGPLKRYYLVCRNADFSEIVYESVSKDKTTVTARQLFTKSKMKKGEFSEPTKKKADLIMKTIAAFLLEQEFRDTDCLYDGFVPVNLTDIANWLAGSSGTGILKSFRIKSRPLFKFEDIDNVAAISIDAEWMNSCGWRIISEECLDSFLSAYPDADFYSDFGAGQFMRKGVRYS